jgi:hexokinase
MRAALEADAGAAVDRVRRVLDIPHARLLRVSRVFARALEDAIAGRPSSLDARPSHLHQLPTGAETGTYLAMDLGTSLIHVACVSFFGGGLHEVQQVQHAIPEVVKSADTDTFFNFLADVVEEALRESGGLMLSSMHLGVTWSFRLE